MTSPSAARCLRWPIPHGDAHHLHRDHGPPGFENNVNWLASTKLGTATPTLGHGAAFTTTFSDTFGEINGSVISNWLGVKADNVTVGQDQIPPVITGVSPAMGSEGTVITITGFNFDTNPLNSCIFIGTGARAQVTAATSTQLTAVIGPVFQALPADVVTVVTGTGAAVPDSLGIPFASGAADVMNATVLMNGFLGSTPPSVAFQPATATPSVDRASVAGNAMTVTLTGSWADGNMALVDLHLLCSNHRWQEVVFKVTFTIPAGTAPGADCAAAIAAIINGPDFPCSASSTGATITITKTGGIVDGFGTITLK